MRMTAPLSERASKPPWSKSTSHAWSAVMTIRTKTSASFAASEAVAALLPPAETNALTADSRRSKPDTEKPALTRLAAIGRPIAPKPTNPTLIMPQLHPSLLLRCRRPSLRCVLLPPPWKCHIGRARLEALRHPEIRQEARYAERSDERRNASELRRQPLQDRR